MRIFIAIALLLPYHYSANAQQRRLIQFGSVTTEEMKMSVYDRDSSASAVILHDKGHFNGSRFEFTRHVRIKILSSSGTSYGNFTIRVPSKGFIDGYTFNMQNAILQTTKLDKSNIYSEDVNDGSGAYKVFFPEVKPGSVIDLRYTHMGLPFEWRFQDVIPVRYSELTLEPSKNIFYKKIFYGFEKVTEIKNNEFIAEYMPAIKIEPLMNHYSNYTTRFQFDIESVSFPNWTYYRDFSTRWEKVGKRLMENDYFGGIIRGESFLNDKAREIEQSNASVSEKVNAAVSYIRDNIKWNHNFGVIAARSFREDFKSKHSGNSATINLLLVALLKKSGITTYPVVLSTRDNGLINPASASLNKLNYLVACVKDGDRSLLVDASAPHTVPGVLPEHCLNQAGWMIEDMDRGQMIDLTPTSPSSLKRFIMIKPNEHNELIAEVTSTYEGYAYLDWITEFEKYGNEQSYGEYMMSNPANAQIETYSLTSRQPGNMTASEVAVVNVSGPEYLQPIGDGQFAFNPFLFNDIVNPFKENERHFPIDFIYPRKRTITISTQIPAGYEIVSFPQSSRVDFPGDRAKFLYLSSVSNNIVTIRCDFAIAQTLFAEDKYDAVKAFFTQVIRKLSESIQLNKI